VAHSEANTVALVELYTAFKGCSGCARAEAWLSGLGPAEKLLPVAVPLDEPYANRVSPLRERRLTPRQRMALVYTPQVLLQGRDFRGWGTPAFGEAVAKINARAARARLSLEIVQLKNDSLIVRAAAEVLDAHQVEHAGLYLAAYENRLDPALATVLEWQGPLAFSRARLAEERALPLRPGALAAGSGVVGFVQNRRTAEILQAAMLPFCT
jgi:hypothetical protein